MRLGVKLTYQTKMEIFGIKISGFFTVRNINSLQFNNHSIFYCAYMTVRELIFQGESSVFFRPDKGHAMTGSFPRYNYEAT